jgi:histidinol dehydrogenase
LNADELARLPNASRPNSKPQSMSRRTTSAASPRKQLPRESSASFGPGLRLGQVVRPLDTVAAYIPAGRYPLPSTLIMTAVPALVAGVKNVCAACPKPVDEVFGTAHLLGVHQVFQMGGAQAIAAFAYGTKTVPRADRIVGPGNIYVAAAKKLLAGEVGIDFVAGPTEILIIAADADPKFLAADMLAQAEHDTDASAILLTTSKKLATRVAKEIERQLATLPTAPVARKAIDKNSAIIVVRSLDEAVELSNDFAPEHLAIHHEELIPHIRHAGSIFVGRSAPKPRAITPPDPTTSCLPAAWRGCAAASPQPITSRSFRCSNWMRRRSAKLAPSITTLARAEGLEAHARSVEVRLA